MKHIFTVSQVNSYIHRIFDSDYALRRIDLKGEVSNCKYHSNGHIYFSLKDETSAIRCLMFSGDRRDGLHFLLQNGQSVIVSGNISVFERDGGYQLYAREITLSGLGELYLKYEQLKEELAEEGYFDFDYKKELPAYPQKIGIVTALTGAAIEDIKSIALRRNPFVQLYLYPAKVQGDGSALTIARGIEYFDRFGVDVIIIGRGGGSMEDLWSFNERVVADAIFQAKTPIISGTGHEIDMTIADYCADVRAATPSAACELAIPDIYHILQRINDYEEALSRQMDQKLRGMRRNLQSLQRVLEGKSPEKRLYIERIQLGQLEEGLHRVMSEKHKGYQRDCEKLGQELERKIQSRLGADRHRYEMYVERLHALSPTRRLQGGYAFAQQKDKKPITSAQQAKEEQSFDLIFSDGTIEVKAERIT